MAAAAFVANIVLAYADGYKESVPMTCSDVTTEEWVAPDGTDFLSVSGGHGNAAIVDIILSAAGTDCRTSTIRINTKAAPEIVLHGGNVGTVVARQFQQTPLKLPAGAKVEFTQLT
jgi:xanthine/CO dehydrogenase XdhC/CoxF family maturation factor